jgi:hypothetical protein
VNEVDYPGYEPPQTPYKWPLVGATLSLILLGVFVISNIKLNHQSEGIKEIVIHIDAKNSRIFRVEDQLGHQLTHYSLRFISSANLEGVELGLTAVTNGPTKFYDVMVTRLVQQAEHQDSKP